MHNTARTISRKVRNTAHSVVKHTRSFVKNHRRAIEITRNVVAIASIALIAIPLVAPVAIPAMAIAALGIAEVGLDLAVGDNTSAAIGLLCLFPMSKGFKYVTEIGGDAIKGGSKAKNLYKAEGLLKMDLQKFGKGAGKAISELGSNKIHHILQDHHDWGKMVKDPKDWSEVSKIVSKVLNEGVEGTYKSVYSKTLNINGNIVEVTYVKLKNGIIKISDAWIRK
ncbi:Uncharacterised protein [Clostridium botulinum]|uniref:polymorphic toxin type 35 domain-containing protein n=2 Tax=Clostridium TaxID=1485 RepID=UPI000DF8BC15|nr:polymorphic toxin type 35 domain-containing protein [Clostridium sporogenes]STC72739.1 Uncharacterised protein [Clostridium botulinum]